MSIEEGDHTVETSSLRLTHAAVMTTNVERAVDFYRDVVGLSLRTIENDPIRTTRRRAMLVDGMGRDVLEIIEMDELAHPSIPGRGGIHHIGFHLSKPDWHSLRARMDASGYAYEEIQGRLFVRDADGLVLEIERV